MTVRPRLPESHPLATTCHSAARSAPPQKAWLSVLKKLAAGERAEELADGGARLGESVLSPEIVQHLKKNDLIEPKRRAELGRKRSGPTVLALSPPGAALLRRIERTRGGRGAPSRVARRRRSPLREAPSEASQAAFRAQHQAPGVARRETPFSGSAGEAAPVNFGESPLGWLSRRKGKDGRPLISETQYEAGERLRRDFELAGLAPRLTVDWAAAPGGRASPQLAPGELRLAAKERFSRALDAVGPDLADPLVRVACFLEGLESVEHTLGWPTRSGKLILAIALQALVRHYRLYEGDRDEERRV